MLIPLISKSNKIVQSELVKATEDYLPNMNTTNTQDDISVDNIVTNSSNTDESSYDDNIEIDNNQQDNVIIKSQLFINTALLNTLEYIKLNETVEIMETTKQFFAINDYTDLDDKIHNTKEAISNLEWKLV